MLSLFFFKCVVNCFDQNSCSYPSVPQISDFLFVCKFLEISVIRTNIIIHVFGE